jgi:tetratricopeptide (TPR) repeat protein
MIRNLTLFVTLFVFASGSLYSQVDSVQTEKSKKEEKTKKTKDKDPSEDTSDAGERGDINRADRLFFNENYTEAMAEYMLILDRKPEDIHVNYNLGLCYLNSDYEKVESIQYFEKVAFYDDEAATIYFLLGKAYQSDMQFDRAIDMFTDISSSTQWELNFPLKKHR